MSCKKDTVIKQITNRFIDMVMEEMNNEETRSMVRLKLVNPLLHMIYSEISPYLYGFFIAIFLILLFTLLTFVLFILSLFPKNKPL